MAKLEIVDQCLTPEILVTLTYSGADPWGVAKKIGGIIRPFFHVSASGTSQTQINWDSAGDPIRFYSTWWVKKKFSRFSFMWIDIKIQGSKSKATNRGEFVMELKGILNTNFEGHAFLKALWMFYSYIFYNRQRAGYIEACRNFIISFRNEVKEHFNLKTTFAPSLRGSIG